MQKMVYVGVIALVAGACLFLMMLYRRGGDPRAESAAAGNEALRQRIAALEQHIAQAASAKSAAERTNEELEQEVRRLREERQADRQVIEELWTTLRASTRHQRRRDIEDGNDAGPAPQRSTGDAASAGRTNAYDADSVKKLLVSSGGDLDAAIRQILTPEGLDRTLREHADQPAYWTATASLTPDREAAIEYLKEAARLHPDSPMVLAALAEAQAAAGVVDESTMAYLDEMGKLDPTNALADCYAAYCQFQNGDVAGALESLAQAGAKGRFADDRIDTLMARYNCLLNEGCSDAVALGLSAFTLPLEHLGMLRQTGQQSIEQVQALSAAGRYDDALQIAQDVSNLGRTVSSSGRFLAHDRVGMAMQESALAEQRRIYEAQGDARRMEEIDFQLEAIQARSATIDVMAEAFGGVLANMTEADLAGYVDATILNGEFATLQSIPEVADALAQAQDSANAPAPAPEKPKQD